MLAEIESSEDTWVIERFKDLKLLKCRSAYGFAGGLVFTRYCLEPNPPTRFCRRVLGLEILTGKKWILLN